jgi:uncharacterized iron-regulated protein
MLARLRLLPALLPALILLGACAPQWRAEHYRDHPLVGRIWSVAEARVVERAELIAALAAADFVLLGETHDNPDHHLLQAETVAALATAGRRPALAFEMLDVSQGEALAAHLAASPNGAAGIGAAVGWDKSGWPDWALYQPVAEAGLAAGLTLRAANMSRAEARGLAKSGLAGAPAELVGRLMLDKPLPEAGTESLHREIDEAHCGYAPKEMIAAMAFAQTARDAHMAHAMIAGGADANAGTDGAILIAGAGHARRDRGVPFHLARLAPGRTAVSLAFLEVLDGADGAAAYGEYFGGMDLPFDYVWFTPRVDIRDACERFEEQLKKMKGGSG